MNTPSKKILIDLERLRYPNTGLANVFKNLTKGILQYQPTLDITYFGTPKTVRKISEQLRVLPFRHWHRFYESFSQTFDIIHLSNQGSVYFQQAYPHTQKILTLHDLNFLHEDLSSYKRDRLLQRVNANLRNTQYLVCISDFVKQDVLKNASLLHLDKLKELLVIHNGIVLPAPQTYSLEGKLAFLKERKYLLNIGVLFNKKNQKSLVEMLPYTNEDLVLVTSEQKDSYTSEVKEAIARLGLAHRVHFFSNVTEAEKNALLQHAVGLCQPSLAEGFGIPPIEAMAFGKPIFLSTYTSLPEIGGKEAFYFRSFNPEEMAATVRQGLEAFWSNKEASNRLKERAAEFNHLAMAQKYLDLYNRI